MFDGKFNLDFSWPSTINFRSVETACSCSAYVALCILCPRNEHSEGNCLNTCAEGTIASDLSGKLQALIA